METQKSSLETRTLGMLKSSAPLDYVTILNIDSNWDPGDPEIIPGSQIHGDAEIFSARGWHQNYKSLMKTQSLETQKSSPRPSSTVTIKSIAPLHYVRIINHWRKLRPWRPRNHNQKHEPWGCWNLQRPWPTSESEIINKNWVCETLENLWFKYADVWPAM